MAATISSYFHPIFRSHLPNSNKSFDSAVEISYSYSELPALGHRSLELGGVGRKEVLAAKSLERVKKSVFGNVKRKSNDDLKRQSYPNDGRDEAAGANSVSVDRKLSRSRILLFQNSSVVNSKTGETSRRASNESESSSNGSNVEKVKRRLEEQLSHEQKKTAFEPPPRRRLADSIFASFKLPRKKSDDSGGEKGKEKMSSQARGIPCSNASVYQNKRKSAVELLAETKAFYVKSETVLDRKQELPLRLSAGLGQAIAAGGCVPVSSNVIGTGFPGPYVGGSPAPCTTSRNRSNNGQSGGPSRPDGLQSTLRRLLQHTDSRESLQQPVYAVPVRKSCRESHKSRESLHSRSSALSGAPPSGASGTSSGTSGSKHCNKSDPDFSRGSNSPTCLYSGRAEAGEESHVFFPDSFVVPSMRPAETPEVFKNKFSMGSSLSSPEDGACVDPACNDLDDYATISPPAEYALTDRSGYRYVRSNSHSQPQNKSEDDANNINSHKSLPDLHSQAHCFPEDQRPVYQESGSGSPCGWSRRACSGNVSRRRRRSNGRHHEPGDNDPPNNSYSSKGTRSNRSSIVSSCEGFTDNRSQAGDYTYNRSGSSFARDSGGSSGHYTQRSAPAATAAPPPPRRDSGASTQHTSEQLRYITYYPSDVEMGIQHSPEQGGVAVPWPVSAPLQFQDGIPSPPHPPAPPANYQKTLVGIHFQASIPPPQFQDDPHAVYGFLEPNMGYQQTQVYYGQTIPKCRPTQVQMPPLPPQPPRTTKEGYPAAGLDCVSGDYYDVPTMYLDPQGDDYCFMNPQIRYDGVGATAENDPNRCQSLPHGAPPPGHRAPPVPGPAPGEPLGVFRRQRCLRYKRPAAQRRPILRSKSDVSDRNWRNDFKIQGPASTSPSLPMTKCRSSAPIGDTSSLAQETQPPYPTDTPQVHNLDRFFERLGLDDISYNAIVKTPIRRSSSVRKRSSDTLPDNIVINKDGEREYIESPVFFSDVSTVDSNQIANNADYTVQGVPQSNIYRSNEPPSIVERNARIIKWLCNCRKLQLATQ